MESKTSVDTGNSVSTLAEKEKKVYKQPRLTKYGSVVTLTAGSDGSGVDSNTHSSCSGSSGRTCTT